MQTTNDKTTELARRFAEIVLRDAGVENHAELRRKTAAIVAAGDNICATHDYCDANESMLEAWRSLGLGEAFDTEDDNVRCAQMHLINEAWSLAKGNLFWLPAGKEDL